MRVVKRINFSANDSARFCNKILTHTQKDNRYINPLDITAGLMIEKVSFLQHTFSFLVNDGMSRNVWGANYESFSFSCREHRTEFSMSEGFQMYKKCVWFRNSSLKPTRVRWRFETREGLENVAEEYDWTWLKDNVVMKLIRSGSLQGWDWVARLFRIENKFVNTTKAVEDIFD